MAVLKIDLNNTKGEIKHMNAVNNGPVGGEVRKNGNFLDYQALEIPYARNHDAAAFLGYGGPHTVDIHNIFKNFDADENEKEMLLLLDVKLISGKITSAHHSLRNILLIN